jgi:predicted RNA methylase
MPINWRLERWNSDLRAEVQRLARLRAARAELRDGAYVDLGRGEHWFAFARYTRKSASVLVVNRGPEIAVEIDGHALPVTVRRWLDQSGQEIPLDSDRARLIFPARTARFALSA